MTGPMGKFVEDRAVVFVLVLEAMLRRAEDEVVLTIVESVVPAIPYLGTRRPYRFLSRGVIDEVGIEDFLLGTKMVERSIDLIDVEHGVGFERAGRTFPLPAGDRVHFGLGNPREEDDILSPMSRLDIRSGRRMDLTARFWSIGCKGGPELGW